MNSTHLNEHDANQGAQSSGEFLGMTGNSGWFLLGSGGATILMVILLWGILGVSLLLCLFVGIALCLGSIAYVFALKNNRPEHYDTDFFESALVEAGVLRFSFGPRVRRPLNPFRDETAHTVSPPVAEKRRSPRQAPAAPRIRSRAARSATPSSNTGVEAAKTSGGKFEPMVTRVAYEQLHEKLTNTEELLQDVLAETAED
ncbi:MAG TPA: DUF4133 domain-containing protein [Opitutaceae bacterium]|nr:DUF4133 domain-containing protein [Opitutaceae bacterium]